MKKKTSKKQTKKSTSKKSTSSKKSSSKKKASSRRPKKATTSRRRTRREVSSPPLTSIKVIGVGGGGGNAVSRMSRGFPRGVDFIAINTDHQDLDYCDVRQKLYIGKNLTRGMGAGMNPDLGRQAAEENRSDIAEVLAGADLVFVTGGLGGGTGTGASPIVAEAAKQSGALTFAVVTKPFAFEGSQRQRIAEEGLERLREKVDGIIVVPNDRVFTIIDKDTSVAKAFLAIDDILKNAISGIVDMVMTPGMINVDFADVKAIVEDAGLAIVGVGKASGQDRALKAAESALRSPLLELSPEGARGVVIGISGGKDLKMSEINDAAKLIAQSADPSARIIFGAYKNKDLKPNEMQVTLIATGFSGGASPSSLFGGFQGRSGDRQSSFGSPDRKEGSFFDSSSSEPKKEDMKNEKASGKSKASSTPKASSKDNDDENDGGYPWDVPTFLRKKKR